MAENPLAGLVHRPAETQTESKSVRSKPVDMNTGELPAGAGTDFGNFSKGNVNESLSTNGSAPVQGSIGLSPNKTPRASIRSRPVVRSCEKQNGVSRLSEENSMVRQALDGEPSKELPLDGGRCER